MGGSFGGSFGGSLGNIPDFPGLIGSGLIGGYGFCGIHRLGNGFAVNGYIAAGRALGLGCICFGTDNSCGIRALAVGLAGIRRLIGGTRHKSYGQHKCQNGGSQPNADCFFHGVTSFLCFGLLWGIWDA